MDTDKGSSQGQPQGSDSQGSQDTQTTDTNAGSNLPARDPQILEEGNKLSDLEKRNK